MGINTPPDLVKIIDALKAENRRLYQLIGSQVAFEGRFDDNATHSIAANTNFPFTTLDDPSGGWDATNHQWNCPVTGRYLVSGALKTQTTAVVTVFEVFVNNVQKLRGGNTSAALSASTVGGRILQLSSGDFVSAQAGVTFISQNDGVGVSNTHLTIVRVTS